MTVESLLGHYRAGAITATTTAIHLMHLIDAENVGVVMPALPSEVYSCLCVQVGYDASNNIVSLNAPEPPDVHRINAVRQWLSQRCAVF